MEKTLVCKHTWKNGQTVSAYYFDRKPRTASDPSDVIKLEIRPSGRKPTVFFLNIEDCTAIIHALSTACTFAIRDRQPVGPVK